MISGCGDNLPTGSSLTSTPTNRITATAGTSLSAFYGNFVTGVPQVTVTDKQNKPLVGDTVHFAATGGGRVTGATALTDSAGHAAPTSWRLGSSGAQALTVSVTGALPISITAAAAEPPASSFHIQIRYADGTTPNDAEKAAFDAAAARWSQIILQGGAPYSINELSDGCGDLRGQTVDGVVITANLTSIDGAGKILGSAGPCILRDVGLLPAQGYMEFDTADLAALEANGQLQQVILHEMGHVLGFGSIWSVNPGNGLASVMLLDRSDPNDPVFRGPASLSALFGLAGPTGFLGTAVPVENTGGEGTAYAHWRESVFGSELMTGWLNAGSNPLSALTIAQFRDLGYVVNDALGDGYSFAAAIRAAGSEPLQLNEGRLTMPLIVINRAGNLVGRIQRIFK
jgi:hypothetical protein